MAAEHSDEGQDEHGILFGPALEATACWLGVLLFQDLADLVPPFVLEFADAKQGSTHDGDDDAGNQCEDTFPDVLCRVERILASSVDLRTVS